MKHIPLGLRDYLPDDIERRDFWFKKWPQLHRIRAING